MRTVFHAMGMPISVDIPACDDAHIFLAVETIFRDCDNKFSTYIADSEVMAVQRGERDASSVSVELMHVWSLCEYYTERTGGYFSHYYKGLFDPTGLTKAYAIQLAVDLLERLGYVRFCINAGGDIAVRSDGKPWVLGLQHPQDMSAVMGTVSLTNGALATSGTYVRGSHIIDPVHGSEPDCISVTVTGPDIITEDVLATALFAMGRSRGIAFMRDQRGYEALFIDHALSPVATPGFLA